MFGYGVSWLGLLLTGFGVVLFGGLYLLLWFWFVVWIDCLFLSLVGCLLFVFCFGCLGDRGIGVLVSCYWLIDVLVFLDCASVVGGCCLLLLVGLMFVIFLWWLLNSVVLFSSFMWLDILCLFVYTYCFVWVLCCLCECCCLVGSCGNLLFVFKLVIVFCDLWRFVVWGFYFVALCLCCLCFVYVYCLGCTCWQGCLFII